MGPAPDQPEMLCFVVPLLDDIHMSPFCHRPACGVFGTSSFSKQWRVSTSFSRQSKWYYHQINENETDSLTLWHNLLSWAETKLKTFWGGFETLAEPLWKWTPVRRWSAFSSYLSILPWDTGILSSALLLALSSIKGRTFDTGGFAELLVCSFPVTLANGSAVLHRKINHYRVRETHLQTKPFVHLWTSAQYYPQVYEVNMKPLSNWFVLPK